MTARRRLLWMLACAALAVLVAGAAAVRWLNHLDEAPLPAQGTAPSTDPAVVERGAYLARVGNCIACHSAPGGAPLAGALAVQTPFGAIYSSNLTPDADTGLGLWTAEEFWRALHNGRSRDGRLLYPAFPYTSFTQLTREDSDALFAFLRSVPTVRQAPPAHELAFPANSQGALALWRALYFRPGSPPHDEAQPPQWNRGAYLVRAVAHCAACHTPRNALGGLRGSADLTGAWLPGGRWYAPSLVDPAEASLAAWPPEEAAALLASGVSRHGSVSGPMAEVVFTGLQYLDAGDLDAMVGYLRALEQRPARKAPVHAAPPAVLERGREVYAQHCAQCHGRQGEGRGGFVALAGRRAVTLEHADNLVQMLVHGGYAPATRGNPRPHGMPPFAQQLSDADMAAVLSYIRSAWGNQASAVNAMDIHRARERR